MIVEHQKKGVVLRGRDAHGVEHHEIPHSAFKVAKPQKDGGDHPYLFHEVQTWLHVPGDPSSYDFSTSPVKPVVVENVLLPHSDVPISGTYIPIDAWLQAEYGEDKVHCLVPINGDANAQHLHWLHRDAKGRQEMRAILECLNAWRLNDDGSPASDEQIEERNTWP